MARPEFCSDVCPQWMVCAYAFRGAECPFAKVDKAIEELKPTNTEEAIPMRLIRTTFEIITPESVEHGEAEETGWIDEEGESMEPDQYDLEEGLTAVDIAVAFLRRNIGAEGMEASSSGPLSLNDWWTAYKYNLDYETGAVENRSYHPVGFTAEEINEINNRLEATA